MSLTTRFIKILLAILLPVLAHAGMNTNSVDVFNAPVNCTNEASALGQSSAPMSVTGTVVYATSPAPPNSGTYCATGSDSNYWNWSALTCSEFSGIANGGLEMNVYFTSIVNNRILFEYTDPVGIVDDLHQAYIIIVNSTSWELVLAGNAVLVATNSITLNTWHNFVWYWNGVTMTMTMDGTVGGTLTTAFQTHSITSGVIGRGLPLTGSGFNINGYYTQVRFLKSASGNPTTDSVSCGGNSPTPTPVYSATNTPLPTNTFTLTPTPVLTFTPNPSITPGPPVTMPLPWKALNNGAVPTESGFRALCDYLHTSGIAAAYTAKGGKWFVHIDDQWAQATRDGSGKLQASASFPHLLDGGDLAYAHADGVYLSLYVDMGTTGCLGSSAGSQGHEQSDMQQLSTVADHINADTCNKGQVNPQDSTSLLTYWWHVYNPGGTVGMWGPPDTNAASYSWQPSWEPVCGVVFWWTPVGDGGGDWNSNITQWSNAYDSGANAYVPTYGRNQQGSVRIGEVAGQASDQGMVALAAIEHDPWVFFALTSSSPAYDLNMLSNTHVAQVEDDALGMPGVTVTAQGNIEAVACTLTGASLYGICLINNTAAGTEFTFNYSALSRTGQSAALYNCIDNLSLGTHTTNFVQYVSPYSAALDTADFCYLCTPSATPTATPTLIPTITPVPTVTPGGYNYNQQARRRRFFNYIPTKPTEG